MAEAEGQDIETHLHVEHPNCPVMTRAFFATAIEKEKGAKSPSCEFVHAPLMGITICCARVSHLYYDRYQLS
jgi:hypothetical protein